MLKKQISALKLAVLSCAILFLCAFSTSIAQVSSPKNLNVSVENGKALLSWEVPDNGTAVKYYIYKAYAQDTDTDPASLQFAKSDSTTSLNYSDDLSLLSSEAPVAFYYITAVNENSEESSPSNTTNATVSQQDENENN